MNISVIPSGVFSVNSLVVSLSSNKCFVVDPAACPLSGDANKIINYLNQKQLECIGIILTHSHFDHITGINPLKNAFPNAKVALHENEKTELENPPGPMNTSVISYFGYMELLDEVAKQPSSDILLKNGQNLSCINETVNELKDWKVIHTPGHSEGSICIYNEKEKTLISGDTLFAYGSYGRTDMYGGNEAKIRKSLSYLLENLPGDTIVFPGHDAYGFNLKE